MVRLRSSVDVSSGDRAAHDHDVANQGSYGRVLGNCQRDIRKWPDGNQGQLMWVLVRHLDDEIGAEARICLAFRRWQFHSGETVLAMPELRGDQFLVEGVLRPGRNRDIA